MEGEVSTKEAAALLGVHTTTVQRMVKRGELQPVRKVALSFMFRRSDIEAKAA